MHLKFQNFSKIMKFWKKIGKKKFLKKKFCSWYDLTIPIKVSKVSDSFKVKIISFTFHFIQRIWIHKKIFIVSVCKRCKCIWKCENFQFSSFLTFFSWNLQNILARSARRSTRDKKLLKMNQNRYDLHQKRIKNL